MYTQYFFSRMSKRWKVIGTKCKYGSGYLEQLGSQMKYNLTILFVTPIQMLSLTPQEEFPGFTKKSLPLAYFLHIQTSPHILCLPNKHTYNDKKKSSHLFLKLTQSVLSIIRKIKVVKSHTQDLIFKKNKKSKSVECYLCSYFCLFVLFMRIFHPSWFVQQPTLNAF